MANQTSAMMSDREMRVLLRKLTDYAAKSTMGMSKDDCFGKTHIVGLAMWLRAIESCEATHLLTTREMYGAAWATLRLAYESLFYACALVADPSRAEKLAESHLAELDKLLFNLANDARLGNEKAGSPPSAKEKSTSTHKKWSAYDAAKDAGLLEVYSEWFRVSSQIGAHANGATLDQHIAKDGVALIRRGGRFDKSVLLTAAINCMHIGISRIQEKLTAEQSNHR